MLFHSCTKATRATIIRSLGNLLKLVNFLNSLLVRFIDLESLNLKWREVDLNWFLSNFMFWSLLNWVLFCCLWLRHILLISLVLWDAANLLFMFCLNLFWFLGVFINSLLSFKASEDDSLFLREMRELLLCFLVLQFVQVFLGMWSYLFSSSSAY